MTTYNDAMARNFAIDNYAEEALTVFNEWGSRQYGEKLFAHLRKIGRTWESNDLQTYCGNPVGTLFSVCKITDNVDALCYNWQGLLLHGVATAKDLKRAEKLPLVTTPQPIIYIKYAKVGRSLAVKDCCVVDKFSEEDLKTLQSSEKLVNEANEFIAAAVRRLESEVTDYLNEHFGEFDPFELGVTTLDTYFA